MSFSYILFVAFSVNSIFCHLLGIQINYNFFQSLLFIEKTVKYIFQLKYTTSLSITLSYLLESLWIPSRKNNVFGQDEIKPFVDLIYWLEVYIVQTMLHRTEQRVIGRDNIWRICRVLQDISAKIHETFFCPTSNVWPGVVMQQYHRTFFFTNIRVFALQFLMD